MIAFLKRHALDLFIFLLLVAYLLCQAEPLILRPERFDELATIGWTAIPFALCWLMLSVTSYLKAHAYARQIEAAANAGKTTAEMWDIRHSTKQLRAIHSK